MYEVVWPRSPKTAGIVPLAKRLDTLEGETIGQLWNWSFRGDELFPIIENEVAKRYPGVKFLSYEKFGRIHGADEKTIIETLGQKLLQSGCDAVMTGMGC